jgi:hypothetical protein
MDTEDGVIGVYAVGDEKVMGVTDFGTEKPNPLRKGVLRATPAHTLQSSSLGMFQSTRSDAAMKPP